LHRVEHYTRGGAYNGRGEIYADDLVRHAQLGNFNVRSADARGAQSVPARHP
jgi:hypothetical protein